MGKKVVFHLFLFFIILVYSFSGFVSSITCVNNDDCSSFWNQVCDLKGVYEDTYSCGSSSQEDCCTDVVGESCTEDLYGFYDPDNSGDYGVICTCKGEGTCVNKCELDYPDWMEGQYITQECCEYFLNYWNNNSGRCEYPDSFSCTINSDCVDNCTGINFLSGVCISGVCNQTNVGITVGECGVECTIDSQCAYNEICDNYECKEINCTADLGEYRSSCEINPLTNNWFIRDVSTLYFCQNPGTLLSYINNSDDHLDISEPLNCLPGCSCSGNYSLLEGPFEENYTESGVFPTCQFANYTSDASCNSVTVPKYTYQCNNNWYDIYNVASAAFNYSFGSSCLWGSSCYTSSADQIGNLEECQFGCSSGGGPCEHRYCIDSDGDGYANGSDCWEQPARYSLDEKWLRTDYRYEFFSDTKNWEDAQASCVAKGGNLVQITDWVVNEGTGELNTEIKDLLNTKFLGQEYWIGLKDKDNLYLSSNFYWPKGNILNPALKNNIDYWQSDEPSYTYAGGQEDCVAVQADGKWNDEYCKSYLAIPNKKKYVCELPYVFDCNDGDSDVNPNKTEICGNGIDDDCDGQVDDTCVEITGAHWSDLINRSNLKSAAEVRDTVLMNSEGTGIGALLFNYTVIKKGCNELLGDCKRVLLDKPSFVPYKFDNAFTYFFESYFQGIVNTSGEITILSDEVNALPSVTIKNPPMVTDILSGDVVSFNATVYDEDDFLSVSWNFGDGTNKTFYNYAQATNGSSSLSVNHTYSDCGTFNVQLTVRENERKQVVQDYRDIYVFKEGICVFPVISSPENGRINYENLVRFDARQSFVTNCSKGSMGPESFSVGEGANKLNCTYIHAPNQLNVDTSKYNLSAHWGISPPGLTYIGAWGSSLTSGTIQDFSWWFDEEAQRVASLKLTFSN